MIRILVADDSAPWQRFVSSLVEAEPGWHVVCEVSNGVEAVQKAKELKPDLVLLDIGLPKLDGIEAARQIRRAAPHSKTLFLSVYDSLDIIEEALNTGASGYVVKADAGSELKRALEAVFQGKRFVSNRFKGRISGDAEDPRAHDREAPASPSARALPRKTAITRWHEAHFYSDDARLLDSFTDFIGFALRAGRTAIVVATESHLDRLAPRLRARGSDIARAMGQGSYIALNAADMLARFMVNDLPDPVRFSRVAGDLMASASQGKHTRVAACGECAPLLWAQGRAEAAVRLEQLWDDIAKTHEVDILCGYPTRGFRREEDSHIFQRICQEHSAIYSR